MTPKPSLTADLEEVLAEDHFPPPGSGEPLDPDAVRDRLIAALKQIDVVDELLLLERIAAIADDPFSEEYAMTTLFDLAEHIARCRSLSVLVECAPSDPPTDPTSR